MKTIFTICVAIFALQFSSHSMAEFDYRGIKSGMSLKEVEKVKGIKKSAWVGGLKVNFKKFFGKDNTPPGLRNVFFQFTPKDHGEKLWRVTLQFNKIDSEKANLESGLIMESAQERLINYLYPNAVIKEHSERYKCGDYDFNCKISGNGTYGIRHFILVTLIDSKVYEDAVNFVFNENKDKY